ncbi:membrane protein (plasmid) [Fulvitalea axinellae]|uniref:Membrane protein n=2 Tax=Fulvitalea axinellae TaxID=1182444 RepID=A0AAU9CI41_9BACT|nr:membrane protein [Fulvitalea axinellae]
MKSTYRRLALGLAMAVAAGLSSCSSWLELKPENNLIKEEYWNKKGDVVSVLSSSYRDLRENYSSFLVWGEARGGSFYQGLSNALFTVNMGRIMDGNIETINGLLSWGQVYSSINLANTVIKFTPEVVTKDASFDQVQADELLAEARYIRALNYFYLVKTFGEVPLVLEPSDTDQVDIYPAKSTEAEVMDQIVEDLVFAERYALETFGRDDYDKGRATKGAVRALQAEVYLWKEDYASCLVACEKVITSGKYGLLPKDEWLEIFATGNTNEGIFELQFDYRENQTNLLTLIFTGSNNAPPRLLLHGNMLDLFEPTDIRGEGRTFIGGEDSDTPPIWKYTGLGTDEESSRDTDKSDANWIVHRYADVLLMKAEALAAQNDAQIPDALEILNTIRERAGVEAFAPQENMTQKQWITLLLEERAREFVAEGKRWFDLLRIAKRGNYANKDILIDILMEGVPAGERQKVRNKLQDPMSYYLPIYQKEIDYNRNLKQNPYYDTQN